MKTKQEIEKACQAQAQPLVGKTIAKVKYMSESDSNYMFWSKRPLVIEFTDGSFLVPQMDDEGNDGGALWFQDKNNDIIIPVI